MEDLSQLAISAALCGNWKKAILYNQKIIDLTPDDLSALNRLAKAYAEEGNIKKALVCAKKVLALDPFNSIAKKALEKWPHTPKNGFKNGNMVNISSAQFFLEEPGKTRVVPLTNLGDKTTLLALDCADEVKLVIHAHTVSVSDLGGSYIGRLPDDISNRLKKLTSQGNEYMAIVKSAKANEVKVMIREIKRAPSLSHIASFPSEKISYVAFTDPDLVHDRS